MHSISQSHRSSMTKNFKSDNYFGVHPKIFEGMIAANEGSAGSYGHDKYSEELKEKLAQLFEHEVTFYLVSTGTISNCLCLSALCPSYGSVYCTKEAHINNDECNAPGLYLNGGKLMTFTNPNSPSKIDLKTIENDIEWSNGNIPHTTKPSCITITQSTELGQVYSLAELKEIGAFCKQHKLNLHMDGARFGNALVSLNCTPAEMTWKIGVDVLSFGCTKNGGLMGEVIIFFNQELAQNFDYIHKHSGQLLSKTRFFSAQVLAYLKDDLWIHLAKHSNSLADKLGKGIEKIHQIQLVVPVQANEVFVRMPKEVAETLWKNGFEFYPWDLKEGTYRFVTSWATSEQDVDLFVSEIAKVCNQ